MLLETDNSDWEKHIISSYVCLAWAPWTIWKPVLRMGIFPLLIALAVENEVILGVLESDFQFCSRGLHSGKNDVVDSRRLEAKESSSQ